MSVYINRQKTKEQKQNLKGDKKMTKTKKILIPIIAILVLASVVGIGFAAWLIVNPIDETVDGGSFLADEVKDYTYTATAVTTTAAPDGANTIIFGKGSEPEGGSKSWLSATDVPAEVMSATITVTLTPTDSSLDVTQEGVAAKLLNGNNLKVTVSYLGVPKASTDPVEYENQPKFNDAVVAGYLANPTLTVGSTTKTLEEEAWSNINLFVELTAGDFKVVDGKLTATVTMNFNWGIDGNPYTHFNGQEYSAELADRANRMLTALRLLNGGKYQIHLETVAPTPTPVA